MCNCVIYRAAAASQVESAELIVRLHDVAEVAGDHINQLLRGSAGSASVFAFS